MATYTTLKSGSKGDDVKKLQQSLIDAGYNVGSAGADGIYGNNTAAAVKAYQKANGLTVDGIAGNQTLGALYGGSTATTTPSATTPQQSNTYKFEEFTFDPFETSDTYKNYSNTLDEMLTSGKPTQQESAYQPLLDEALNKYLNREDFSYDLNADALYQQYADQYTRQGQMAMMDTMGQAAAMTGGYGNSYAQGVGQQVYQGYMQELNDKVPELYQLALSKYTQEGQNLKDQISILDSMSEQEYSHYRDTVSDYYNDAQLLADRTDTLYDREYSAWGDKVGMDYNIHTDKQTAGYQEKSDAYDKAMTFIGSGVMPDAETLEMAGLSSAEAQVLVNAVKEQAASGGSGGKGNGYDNGGQTTSDIKKMQAALGISADGKWGPQSVEASGGLTADEAYTAWKNGTLGQKMEEDATYYSDWDEGDWEGYFAQIRQSEGQAAAEEELKYFTSKGLIPTKYVSYGAIGARGGKMGH